MRREPLGVADEALLGPLHLGLRDRRGAQGVGVAAEHRCEGRLKVGELGRAPGTRGPAGGHRGSREARHPHERAARRQGVAEPHAGQREPHPPGGGREDALVPEDVGDERPALGEERGHGDLGTNPGGDRPC